MALTADGRALTEAHRRAQLAVSARAEMDARALWQLLNPADLDGSEAAWLAANLAALRPHWEESRQLAATYVREYRAAEKASPSAVVRPEWDPRYMASNLHMAGPVRVKLLVGNGMSGEAAALAAITKFSGITKRSTLSGGRLLLHETTRRDSSAVGWRRVTDGDPCTFCAMLATRGPVYGNDTVLSTGEGLRYHGGCGCTAEIVYGHWEPSPVEQLQIEEYRRAAEECDDAGLPRTQKNILPRMRANGVFADSPLVRNRTSGP